MKPESWNIIQGQPALSQLLLNDAFAALKVWLDKQDGCSDREYRRRESEIEDHIERAEWYQEQLAQHTCEADCLRDNVSTMGIDGQHWRWWKFNLDYRKIGIEAT